MDPVDVAFIEIRVVSSDGPVTVSSIKAVVCCHPKGKQQHHDTINNMPGPLFTKWMDVLPQDLVKYRSCEIRV